MSSGRDRGKYFAKGNRRGGLLGRSISGCDVRSVLRCCIGDCSRSPGGDSNSATGLSASGLQLDRLLHRRKHWRWLEWASDTNTNFSDSLDSSFWAGTNAQFLGGGQIGVNYEFANGISVGAEAMFDWLSNSQNAIITATDPAGAVAANIGIG